MDTSTLMAAIAVMKNMPDNAAASAAAAAESAEAAQEVLNNIPQDYTELSEDVSNLKSALTDIENVLIERTVEDIPVNATKNNTGISDTGYRFGCTGFAINAYAVTPGDTLHLEILKEYKYCATYMFQDSLAGGTINDGVPTAAPNEYLVGDVVNADVNGDITVPSGAAYLIVAFKVATGAVIQKVTKSDAIEMLESEIEDVDNKVGTLSDLEKPANSIVEAVNDVRETSNPGISVQYAPIKADTIEWENKGISANNGSVTSNAARLKTVYPLSSYIGAVKVESGYRYGIFAYNNGTYVGWWDGSAFTKENIRWTYGVTDLTAGANNNTYDLYVVVMDATGANISAGNINSMLSFYSIARPVIDMQNMSIVQPLIRNGSNGNTSAANPVAMAKIFPCVDLTSIGIVVRRPTETDTNHYKITVTTYDTATDYPTGYSSANAHLLARFDVALEAGKTTYVYDLVSNPTVKGVAFDVTEVDSSKVVIPLRATDFNIGDIALVLNRQPVAEQTNNFMICPWFGNRPVYVPLEGYTVKYGQAFLMYDGKIYSTDGSNVAEQNSSFTVLRDVPLSLGHGNGFELGTNGKGSVSGWDDNKLYVVDLATLAIDDVIQLPTTGYTTAVINEEAGLIYIFQRDSYPNTYEVYNFIVYDYVNSQTVATYKTPVSLRTMQSVDYFGGRIFVVCGSTDVTTHRFLIFDTMCNLICEYKLPDFSGKEPEGVFIDRTDGTVHLMFDNKGIYKIIVG